MRSVVAIAVLAGCGGPKPTTTAPPPDTTRGLEQAPKAPGSGSGSAYVATNDPCEGGEVAMFGDTKRIDAGPASGGSTSGELRADDVNRVIKASSGRIKACYVTALAKEPGLAGKVIVKFTIGPDGKVASATIKGLGPDVDGCVKAAIEQLVFPATGNKSTVTYPFVFNAGG